MQKEEEVKSEKKINIGGISLTQKALFAKNLSVMIKAGITLNEALSISVDSSKGRLKKVLSGILASVQSGHSLSSSLARYPRVFSNLFVSTTYAGESSGTLDQSLENIATHLEKEKELFSRIKGAMLYPIVVLVAAFILAMAMTFFVLPKITPLFGGLKIDLPLSTRLLIRFSTFIQAHGVSTFMGLIVFVLFMIWLLRQKFINPISHWVILKTPFFKNIAHNANLARFCRSLSALLKSGINIDEALKITKDTLGNYYYASSIEEISNRVAKGGRLSDNLGEFRKLYPVMLTKMIRVGEESGKLEDTLLYLANFFELKVENETKALSTIIEPVLLILIGLVVAFLALSIITPIYKITGGVAR